MVGAPWHVINARVWQASGAQLITGQKTQVYVRLRAPLHDRVGTGTSGAEMLGHLTSYLECRRGNMGPNGSYASRGSAR